MRVAVHGVARSGTSLAMQMLAAGGWPCLGDYPSYEPPILNPCRYGATSTLYPWPLYMPDGVAGKLVWPATLYWGPGDFVILCTRDALECAKSQAKFMANFGEHGGRPLLRRLAQMNAEDLMKIRLGVRRVPVLEWPFDRVLADPWAMAARLAEFLGGGLDVDRAANKVVQRAPECITGMLEFALMETA